VIDLSICDSGVFQKLVGEFMVDLVIGCPFVYVCEFGLSQSLFIIHVFFVDVCLQVV
jgi:hypothetical protein